MIGLCRVCASTHKLSPDGLCCTCTEITNSTYTLNQEMICVECTDTAEVLCASCPVYICRNHLQVHKEKCQDREWYPITYTSTYQANDSHGRTILKREKVLRETKELIEERIAEVEAAIRTKAQRELETTIKELQTTNEQFLKTLDRTVSQLRSDFNESLGIFGSLSPETLSDLTTPFHLLLHSFDIQQIATGLSTDPLLQFAVTGSILSDFKKHYFRLDRADSLLADGDCPWARRYFLDLQKRAFIDLKEMERVSCDVLRSINSNSVWISVPDGRIFAISPEKDCVMLDCNYQQCSVVAHTSSRRLCPGLVFLPCKVYIFGGSIHDRTQDTAEVLNTRSLTTREVHSHMLQSRAVFFPCVWSGKVYIAGGIPAAGIEIFNPETEEFTVCDVWLKNIGPSVCLAFEEEVVMLCLVVYSFWPRNGKLETMDLEQHVMRSRGAPQLWEGVYYFGCIDDQGLTSMNKSTFEMSFSVPIKN